MMMKEGTKLGRYEIRSLIGVGGMGEVYRASDPNIGRDVAVKVLDTDEIIMTLPSAMKFDEVMP